MNKDEALKHHAEKYGLTLDQFRMMCESATEMYEGQSMNSLDYALAREAYFAGFTKACKEALEQPAQEALIKLLHAVGEDTSRNIFEDCMEEFFPQEAQQYRSEPEAIRAFHNAKVIRVESGVDVVATWDGKQEKCDIVIKPIVQEAQQEPFGIYHVGDTEDESDFFLFKDSGDVACDNCIKLYTSPPAREFVRLSWDEMRNIAVNFKGETLRAVEKAVAEKNGFEVNDATNT